MVLQNTLHFIIKFFFLKPEDFYKGGFTFAKIVPANLDFLKIL